jgi:hypothetical protein
MTYLKKCSLSMADLFWPLCTQGTDTEENRIRGGGRSDDTVQTIRKIIAAKTRLFIRQCQPHGHLSTFFS